jgi:hypothetical protein
MCTSAALAENKLAVVAQPLEADIVVTPLTMKPEL